MMAQAFMWAMLVVLVLAVALLVIGHIGNSRGVVKGGLVTIARGLFLLWLGAVALALILLVWWTVDHLAVVGS